MDLLRSILRMRNTRGIRPDFERFRRAVTTCQPGPVPVGDIFADFETVGNFLGERVLDYSRLTPESGQKAGLNDLRLGLRYIDQTIRFCLLNGWDYAYCFSQIPFASVAHRLATNTSSEVKTGTRVWMDDNRGPISSWDDFQRYHWELKPGDANYLAAAMAKRVPDGMKIMVIPGGVFEWTTWLMGLMPFSYALIDQPELVDAVIEKVAGIIYRNVADLMEMPEVGGIFMGDDLGFASGTIVAPAVLRQRFLPQTRKIVELVKSAGKVFVLHTCGNVYAVMDDLVGMGIDAKHSFEDKIRPVEEVYARWGQQVALIGGVDVHLLATGSEAEIRYRTRQILDACAPTGHYVLGTGNSVANYIPIQNYLTMLDEGKRWNREHFAENFPHL